jgi:hypothetical protein
MAAGSIVNDPINGVMIKMDIHQLAIALFPTLVIRHQRDLASEKISLIFREKSIKVL